LWEADNVYDISRQTPCFHVVMLFDVVVKCKLLLSDVSSDGTYLCCSL